MEKSFGVSSQISNLAAAKQAVFSRSDAYTEAARRKM
jgi:hypothetical protein